MIDKKYIENYIQDYLKEHNLELINIKVNAANNIKVFFTATDRNVSIDDCSNLSRFIETGLDRDKEDFSLMVSSAERNSSPEDLDDEDDED